MKSHLTLTATLHAEPGAVYRLVRALLKRLGRDYGIRVTRVQIREMT